MSKFGTLKMVCGDQTIKPGDVRFYQVGKTILAFYLSYRLPPQYNRSNLLWQDPADLKKLPAIAKQLKLLEEKKKMQEKILEQQRFI